jgi:hypothetical protein
MFLRRAWLWFLLAAIVAAPALGHMHRIVHGPQAALGHGQALQISQAGAGDCSHGHSWVEGLFSAHDDDSGCRLFDQLSQSDALAALPALALPLFLAPFLLRRLDRDFVARRAALFEARGPPALR